MLRHVDRSVVLVDDNSREKLQEPIAMDNKVVVFSVGAVVGRKKDGACVGSEVEALDSHKRVPFLLSMVNSPSSLRVRVELGLLPVPVDQRDVEF